MSHLKERKEKVCLNCGAAIYGRYCHVCGQENIETKESFWHLVTHFVYDITHFDGKFFSTIKYLLFRPGYLSNEYLRGRRASYLHPIKLYVFTSAFFFLIFFSFYKETELVEKKGSSSENVASIIENLQQKKAAYEGSIQVKAIPAATVTVLKKKIAIIDSNIALLQRDSTFKKKIIADDEELPDLPLSSDKQKYTSIAAYDSIQNTLPKDERDGFIIRTIRKLDIKKQLKYGDNKKAYWENLKENFIHHFPQLLFTSLPLFALMLQLLYVRQKRFYYMNHAIFVIHLYCGTFIILLLRLWIGSIFHWFHAVIPGFLRAIIFFATMLYWYKSFRNFYEQRRGKTILKFIILMFLTCFLMVFLFVAFGIFSVFSI